MPVPSSTTRVRLCAGVLLLSAASAGVAAQDAPANPEAVRTAESGPEMRASFSRPASGRQRVHDSMSDSVRRIERQTRGRVLSIEQMHSDGRDLNRVKVMDDSGRVRIYVDDPARPGRARGNDD